MDHNAQRGEKNCPGDGARVSELGPALEWGDLDGLLLVTDPSRETGVG